MPILGSIIKGAINIRSKIPNRRSGEKQQLKQLKKILFKARNTDFGKQFGFSAILMQEDPIKMFQSQTPIHDYQTIFDGWWHRALKGEKNVSWPGKIKYFALSSGTSESSSKHIPVTKSMIRAIHKGTFKQILATKHFNFSKKQYQTEVLFVGGSTNLNFNGTCFTGDLSGITTGTQPLWFQNFSLPGPEIRAQKSWEDKLEEIVLNAKSWNVGFICGLPAWIQILFERIIQHYQVKTIHEVWPNLVMFVHGGVSILPYKNSINNLCGKPLVYMDTYMASEGFIAYQERPNEAQAMKLMTDNQIFFEFIPFSNQNFDSEGNMLPNANAIDLSKVELNKEYAIVISNCAGAWRYLIGDTIKFLDLKRNEIIITGRTKHFLSLCGEHLSVENMNNAIKLTASYFEININEYCVVGLPFEGLFSHTWYVGIDENINLKELTERLDGHLKELNDDYAVERQHALKEIKVIPLQNKVFIDFLASKNKLGGQSKFPRVLKGKQLNDWRAFIENIKH